MTLPFSVAPTRFPFRALAAQAGRAPMGEREIPLACLMAARLASSALGSDALPAAARDARAIAARSWVASLALPPALRQAVGRLFDATRAQPSPDALAAALRSMLALARSKLSAGAANELERLAAIIAQTTEAEAKSAGVPARKGGARVRRSTATRKTPRK